MIRWYQCESKNGVPHSDPWPDWFDGVHRGARQRPLLLAPHPHDHWIRPPDGSSHCHILPGELPVTGVTPFHGLSLSRDVKQGNQYQICYHAQFTVVQLVDIFTQPNAIPSTQLSKNTQMKWNEQLNRLLSYVMLERTHVPRHPCCMFIIITMIRVQIGVQKFSCTGFSTYSASLPQPEGSGPSTSTRRWSASSILSPSPS